MSSIGRTKRLEEGRKSIRSHLMLGLATATFLVAGVGGWASTTELAGAVIAPGLLVVDSNVKKVQHPTGGIVGELRVREGDRVKVGDLLLRLDATVAGANAAIVTKNLDELAAREARNEAERDGSRVVVFPPDLLARAGREPEVRRLVAGESRLFEVRRVAREGQKKQLGERITQLRQQIAGLSQQAEAKQKEIDLIGPELAGVEDLWKKGLVQISRFTALQRDATRLKGERGKLASSIAETRGKIVETELQILQIDQDMRTEVSKELADIRGRTSEYNERLVSAEDQLRRVDIRAPQDGIIHQMAVHTVGGVITANADPIMLIVPESDELRVEAKIQPQDVDQLFVGQKAVVRFASFNQRTTPELNGTVSLVSADVSQDQRSAQTFYTIHVHLSANEVTRLGGLRLMPGMPAEVFVQTNLRTFMSYLVRPLEDQIVRAFNQK